MLSITATVATAFDADRAAAVLARLAEALRSVEAPKARTRKAAVSPVDGRTLDAKLTQLREFGRPAGVKWLRALLSDNKVERICDLPEPVVDRLLAEFEAAEAFEPA